MKAGSGITVYKGLCRGWGIVFLTCVAVEWKEAGDRKERTSSLVSGSRLPDPHTYSSMLPSATNSYNASNHPYTTASYLKLEVSNYIFSGFVNNAEIEMSQ